MTISYGAHCALLWIPSILCLSVVGVRLFVRRKLRSLGADDLFMTTAVVLQFIAATLAQAMITETEFSKAPKMPRYLQMSAIQPILVYLCLFFGKASVAFLLLRVLGATSRWRRWMMCISLSILGAITLPVLVTSILPSCKLPKASWVVNQCADPRAITGFNQTFNVYSAIFDIFYSFLPLTFVYRLKVTPSKKVFLAVSLGVGWTAAAFSLLRAVSGYAWSGNMDKQIYMSQIATNLEPFFVIICGCLASLMPLFDYFWNGRPLEPRSGKPSYPIGKTFGQGSSSAMGSKIRVWGKSSSDGAVV